MQFGTRTLFNQPTWYDNKTINVNKCINRSEKKAYRIKIYMQRVKDQSSSIDARIMKTKNLLACAEKQL